MLNRSHWYVNGLQLRDDIIFSNTVANSLAPLRVNRAKSIWSSTVSSLPPTRYSHWVGGSLPVDRSSLRIFPRCFTMSVSLVQPTCRCVFNQADFKNPAGVLDQDSIHYFATDLLAVHTLCALPSCWLPTSYQHLYFLPTLHRLVTLTRTRGLGHLAFIPLLFLFNIRFSIHLVLLDLSLNCQLQNKELIKLTDFYGQKWKLCGKVPPFREGECSEA